MKTRIIAAALAATALAAGGAALAQNATATATQDAPSPPGREGGLFRHADADKDGIVTRPELLASVDARFAKGDANKDGKITAEERQAAHKAMREARGGEGGKGWGRRGMRGGRGMGPGPRADANKDGVLTLDEARAPALKLFAYVDRNNDGRIDKAEGDSFREATLSMRGPGGPDRHRGHRGPGRHGRHGPPPAGAPEAPGQ